jgi:hypothetical protein
MKKPSISRVFPVDRGWVDAVAENLEVITGRRKNRITVPVKKTLTFSATPTKAECEALYAYTNTVRAALASLLTRLDT